VTVGPQVTWILGRTDHPAASSIQITLDKRGPSEVVGFELVPGPAIAEGSRLYAAALPGGTGVKRITIVDVTGKRLESEKIN
jgi:hypothetical protein